MAPSLFSLLAAGSFITAALAAPWSEGWPRRNHGHHNWHRYSIEEMQSLKQMMPTLEGLAPNTNVTLFVPVLGVGNQNYTCNGTEFVQTELHSGATADLFDITELLMRDPNAVNTIAQDFKAGRLQGLGPQVGLHYFSEESVPIFNITEAPEEAVLAGKKISAISAPNSEEDIPWLFLLDAKDGISKKLNTVYRVDTDKGVKHREECRIAGVTKSKPYAAQYWFYHS